MAAIEIVEKHPSGHGHRVRVISASYVEGEEEDHAIADPTNMALASQAEGHLGIDNCGEHINSPRPIIFQERGGTHEKRVDSYSDGTVEENRGKRGSPSK